MTDQTVLLSAAIAQGIAAVVLVGITWWYARLTKSLVETAAKQVAMSEKRSREAFEFALRKVRSAIQRVLAALNALPEGEAVVGVETKFRTVAVWDQATVSGIERIGLQIQLFDDADAARFVEDAGWLLQRIRDVRKVDLSWFSVNVTGGWTYNGIVRTAWCEVTRRGRDARAAARRAPLRVGPPAWPRSVPSDRRGDRRA